MADFIVHDEASRERAAQFVAGLSTDRRWRVSVGKPKRSLQQNALYHSWVGQIAAETGHSHDDIHEWLKAEFLPPRFIEIEGTEHEIRRSTTALKVDEMSEFMDRVSAWAASFGIALPFPEDMHRRF